MTCDKAIINRIKRSQGQINGVLNLIEKGASCEEIVMQLKAIKSSIEKSITHITTANLIQNIESKHNLKLDNIEEELELVIKSI